MHLNQSKSEAAWFLAALAILILLSFFVTLGAVPLFDVDELALKAT